MANESGKTISDADIAKMKRVLAQKTGNTVSNDDVKKMNAMLKGVKPVNKAMGGEVMDTTKSMPVGMMDGGKVKKMNMGGVAKGRGGMFKGIK